MMGGNKPKDNTALYIGLGVGGVVLIAMMMMMMQKKLAYEQILNFIEGTIKEGTASTLGIKEGYVNFVSDDPIYIQTVPEEIRKKQEEMLKKIYDGSLDLPVK